MHVSSESQEDSASNQGRGQLISECRSRSFLVSGEKLMSLDRRAFPSRTAASLIATQISPILLGQSDSAAYLTLPPWEPGYLYIHHISTGCGSCALLILPDATTMTIDAGSKITGLDPQADTFLIDPRPNASLRPGQWIARYTQEQLLQAGRNEIDYFVLTHMHDDHFGTVWPGRYDISPRSQFGPYQLGGITDVAETIPVRKVIDRCYPDYAYPAPIPGPQFPNYLAVCLAGEETQSGLFRVRRDRSHLSALRNVTQTSTFAILLLTEMSGQALVTKPRRTFHHWKH